MRLQPPTSVEGWFWPLASHSKFVAIVVPWKLEPNPAMGHSMLYNIHTVMRSEGIYGTYRGSLGYRDDIEKKPYSIEMVSVQASAGLVAGALSSVVTTAIDTVKTRLQVMDNYGDGRPSITKTVMTPLAYFYSPNFPLKL
ncbi:Mitochondrial thiamine pyrophosphate carrier 1 [Bienertia sinuspersici]